MGKTSSKVKSKWNSQHYDCITVRYIKGSLAEIKKLANNRNMNQAQFVRMALLAYCTEEERASLSALVKEPSKSKNPKNTNGGGKP